MPATAQDAKVIDALTDVGKDVGDRNAALAARTKSIGGREEIVERRAGDARNAAGDRFGHGPAVEALQQRFGIEGIDLARATPHEQENDALGLRFSTRLNDAVSQGASLPKQVRERKQAEAATGAGQHVAAAQ